MSDLGSWCTIESDPGIFTQLIEDMGVHGVEAEEIWDLDLLTDPNTYGLVLLFKYSSSEPEVKDAGIPSDFVEGLYFARQVIPNACASMALLAILLNSDIQLGDNLSEFKAQVASFDAEVPFVG